MKLKVSKLKNNVEKMWVIGTDVLPESDLDLMEKKVKASFERETGAIYHVQRQNEDPRVFGNYSPEFQSIMKEALKRNYVWVMFDRDVETQVK